MLQGHPKLGTEMSSTQMTAQIVYLTWVNNLTVQLGIALMIKPFMGTLTDRLLPSMYTILYIVHSTVHSIQYTGQYIVSSYQYSTWYPVHSTVHSTQYCYDKVPLPDCKARSSSIGSFNVFVGTMTQFTWNKHFSSTVKLQNHTSFA